MFKKKGSKTKLFYQYMLSYLIIFLIPYVLISAIFYNISMTNLRKEITLANIQNIEQVSEFADLRMQELKNIATRISLSQRLTPYKLKQPYNRIEAIEDLSSYKVNSSMIDELYLYYQGEEEIFSSQGTSLIPNFLNTLLQVKGDNFESVDIISESADLNQPVVLPIETVENGRKEQMISYVFPITPNSAFSYGTVFFFVHEQTLQRLISNTLRDYDGNIYVFNEQDELLTSSNKGETLDINEIKNSALQRTGVSDKKLNGENYSLVTGHSDITGWTFVTAMPTDQFYDRMSNLKTLILLVFSFIALLGIAFSIFMSVRQYRPIEGLVDFIKQKQLAYISDKQRNEIETIKETIENIHDDSEQLQKKMEINKPLVREQLLLKLLRDNTPIKHKMAETPAYQELQKTFTGYTFFVIVISFKDQTFAQESLQNKEEILQLVNQFTCQDSHGYGVELINDNALVVIVNMPDQLAQPSEHRYHYVEELTKQLQHYTSVISGIGIGEICQGTDKINRSFIEADAANAAIELHLVKNQLTIYFEDIPTPQAQQKIWQPIDNQNKAKLIQSLKQGDQIVAKETLKTMLTDIHQKESTIHVFKCLCFDIINTIVAHIPEEISDCIAEDIKAIVEFRSLDNLEDNINRLIVKICEDIQQRKVSHNLQLRDNILAYIQTHYQSHDLSIDGIAEEFQLSHSYLSRFMKEQTGETFTQYVWGLRMSECKRQLVETELPIKTIVGNIGYIDIANFTRRFKKAEGLTPGQYRKFHTLQTDK